jgi:hypothetical protein
MNYEVKTGAEGVWISVQTATAALVAWGLSQTGMDIVAVGTLAGAAGSIVRPVLGYALSFLPKRKP